MTSAMQWYQNTLDITVSLKVDSSITKSVSAKFGRKHCAIFNGDTTSHIWAYEFSHPVLPSQCKLKKAGKRLEIKLKKETAGSWTDLGTKLGRSHQTQPELYSAIHELILNRAAVQRNSKNNLTSEIKEESPAPATSSDYESSKAVMEERSVPEFIEVVNGKNIRYEFTNKENGTLLVHLSVTKVDPGTCFVIFNRSSVEVQFSTVDEFLLANHRGATPSTSFRWRRKLLHSIEADKCSYSVSKTSIELKLVKSDKTMIWESLVMDDDSAHALKTNGDVTNANGDVTNTNDEVTNDSTESDATIITQTTVDEVELVNDMNDLNLNTENSPAYDSNSDYISNDFNPFSLASKPVLPVLDTCISPSTDDTPEQDTSENAESVVENPPCADNNPLDTTVVHNSEQEQQQKDDAAIVCNTPPVFYCLPNPLNRPCTTGIANLGNTCFMGSVVQCLCNTTELRDYFLGGVYKEDINLQNPLGYQGKLASTFGSFVNELWQKEDRSYVLPYKLKRVIQSISDRFVEYAQHDAHEFVTFLLDALHEDVNRIKIKPQGKEITCDNRTDDDVANETWQAYKSRNNSIFVDLFGGLFKSTLVCPLCSKVSVTFDPFMSLSVPLPKKTRSIAILFVPTNPEKMPRKLVLDLPPDGTLELLKASVSKKTGVGFNQLKVFEAYHGKFQAMMTKNKQFLSDIGEKDIIVVSEVLPKSERGADSVKDIGVIIRLQYLPSIEVCSRRECGKNGSGLKRCTKCKIVAYCNRDCQQKDWNEHRLKCKANSRVPVSFPFIISLPSNQITFGKIAETAEKFASQRLEYSRTKNTAVLSDPSVSQLGPMYYLIPVNKFGEDLPNTRPLESNGKALINSGFEYLAMEWRNNPKDVDHVEVTVKDDLLESIREHKSSAVSGANNKSSINLDDCLQLFTEPEQLPKDNAWLCPQCKKLCEATKQMSIWRLPPVVIIHLKRFSFKNSVWVDKIDKLVSFPLRGLEMSSYLVRDMSPDLPPPSSSAVYDLYATVNHFGSIRRGHYTSIIKSPVTGSNVYNMAFVDCYVDAGMRPSINVASKDWFMCDDDAVSKVKVKEHFKDAYILFYKLRTNNPCNQSQ